MCERSRSWCLTINNYTPDDCEWDLDDTNIDYLILGKEIGKKGTPHLQGFLYSKSKISLKELKKIFPTAHLEIKSSKSSLADAICYCMKDGDYIEFGTRPRQGQRTDLEMIRYDLEKNVPMISIAKNNFSKWCQYRRAFAEYSDMIQKRDTKVIVYKKDDSATWAKISPYLVGKYVVLTEISDWPKLYPYYYGKVYDNIITPQTAYTDDFTEKKNLIII